MSDVADMPIKAIAPWFGGKRTLASAIVAELGEHSAYWDPFCGGLSVLFAKQPSSHETVNDLHGELINLARVLADEDQAPRLYGRLARVLVDEQRRDESLAALAAATEPIERAFHWFIVQWFGRNGFSGTKGSERSSFAVRWTPNGGHGGQRFHSAVESIPAWHHRLRRVTILSRDAFGVLEKIDDNPKVAIYCDPPYIVKAATYEHDFSSDDHKRLADALARFKQARVVVSYYRDPRLAELYAGWTCLDCAVNKGLHNAGRRGSEATTAPEVLLINGPSYTQPADVSQRLFAEPASPVKPVGDDAELLTSAPSVPSVVNPAVPSARRATR
jgi:DNA adenine methylase